MGKIHHFQPLAWILTSYKCQFTCLHYHTKDTPKLHTETKLTFCGLLNLIQCVSSVMIKTPFLIWHFVQLTLFCFYTSVTFDLTLPNLTFFSVIIQVFHLTHTNLIFCGIDSIWCNFCFTFLTLPNLTFFIWFTFLCNRP